MPKMKGEESPQHSDTNTENNICVTCLTETKCEDVFILTFEDMSFYKVFKSCIGFELSENSWLKYICLDCIQIIVSFHKFKETAVKSYEELCTNETEKSINLKLEENNFKIEEDWTSEEEDDDDDDPMENSSNNSCNENTIEFISIEGSNTIEYTESESKNQVKLDGLVKVELKEENDDDTSHESASNKDTSCKVTSRPQKGTVDVKGSNVWRCSYCSLTISKDNPAEIKKHRYAEKVKRLRIFPCPVCKKKFTKSVIEEHILRHGDVKPAICEICGKGMSSNQTLKQHMMLHTGYKYTCNTCDKGFTQPFLLKEHMHIHNTTDKKFLCPTCGLSFTNPTNLRQHQYKHRKKTGTAHKPRDSGDLTEILRHVCDYCGKNFSSVKTLAVHRSKHDSNEHFECDRCGKKFAHRALLTSHIWLHIAEFRCLKCYKIYKKDDLKTHECNPLPEGQEFDEFLPNECRECGEILQDGHMERHMRRHEARECQFCGEKIIGARKFQFHMNLHRLKCDMCDKAFAKKESFLLHMRNRVCDRSREKAFKIK